ncbi:MAG TPA: hypothetical protein VNA22_03370, partial [Pyrinomonadaceae bacterium]|nr:hypothetical protein [Pyrinomonadaceae bacterium]
MNQLILGLRLPLLPLLILTVATASFAQTTEQREIAAMTFQSGREFQVPMTGTPRYPKLRGAMKVKFSQKSGTKVDLSVSELPPILSLGGLYMSWVVWTIGSDGRVENVGNLKSSLRGSNDGGVDFSTSLSTFAVVVSAEPFAEVRRPGPVVVLESNPHGSEERHSIVSKRVTYPINQSDFYRDDQVPGSDEKAYRKQRPELLRAERARRYAQYAGADSLASELYKKLVEKLESLKDDISKDLNDKILEQRTVEIEELAADAEAEAERVRASRQVQQAERKRNNEQKEVEKQLIYYENAAKERADALEDEKGKRAAADRR